jgi:hypothetical protein
MATERQELCCCVSDVIKLPALIKIPGHCHFLAKKAIKSIGIDVENEGFCKG